MWLIRPGESSQDLVQPLTSINMNLASPAPGEPALLSFEEARVLFHEFGHALHTLLCDVAYPSLGVLAINPDVVELPSILNERWLATPEVLRRFAVHHLTGEPMPQEFVDALEAARLEDPSEGATASLGYLATAVVDLELHLAADGGDLDPVALEVRVLAELGLPPAFDPLHRAAHFKHAFAGLYEDRYASCYYGYLWAEMLAADVAEAFEHAPGGLYDRETAARYARSILGVGHRVPAAEAFASFQGRGPDPAALQRRVGAVGPEHCGGRG
jgi:peptidyl-dipeptidase Dcp